MRSHLISQLLLKRFSKNNRVKVQSKFFLGSRLESPEKLAYIEVPTKLFSSIEHKFGYPETRMATAFSSLDLGTLLQDKSTSKLSKNL